VVAGERVIRDRNQSGFRIFRKGLAGLLHEQLEDLVHHTAAVQRTDLCLKRIERPQPENMPRIDRVGVANPFLDLGDR